MNAARVVFATMRIKSSQRALPLSKYTMSTICGMKAQKVVLRALGRRSRHYRINSVLRLLHFVAITHRPANVPEKSAAGGN